MQCNTKSGKLAHILGYQIGAVTSDATAMARASASRSRRASARRGENRDPAGPGDRAPGASVSRRRAPGRRSIASLN